MRCEGRCGRSFRNGERVHAIPTRIVVLRGERETFNIVDRMLCASCYVDIRSGDADASDWLTVKQLQATH